MVGLPGTRLDPETRGRLQELSPAGVILFARNLEGPGQTAALIGEVRRLLPSPALIALDQEGGRVSRLERWIGPTPSAVVLGRAGESMVWQFGEATATALRGLGFDLDFAPVVDLCAAETPNGIGDRSFGTDPLTVSRLAGAFLAGLQSHGVAGCLKHFPGLGDTSLDTHVQMPTVERSRLDLERLDILPFRDLAANAASVMVGHAHYTAFDPDQALPASLSPRVVAELLRVQLGYQGLVVSDDLEMGAVAQRDVDGTAAVDAIAAGSDLLLYCSDLERADRAAAALEAESGKSESLDRRLEQAVVRIESAARRWAGGPADLVAWDAARRQLGEFIQRS
jgi:beta-N-acetylhexosaminidase